MRVTTTAKKTVRLSTKRAPPGMPDFSKVHDMRRGMQALARLMAWQRQRGFTTLATPGKTKATKRTVTKRRSRHA